MKSPLLWIAVSLLGCITTQLTGAPAETPPLKSTDLWPFCIDTHDARKRNLEEQAAMLKELGYPGMGHLWLDNVPERLKTLDAAGVRLVQITLNVDISSTTPYDARLKSTLPLLAGRHVQLSLLVNGGKPSDASQDPRAVAVIREMADLAKDSGTELVLYPHTGCWVETIQDAVRVCKQVERPNVGVMFNLCHWLRVNKDRDYETPLKAALPWLKAVSINGADELDPQPGWSRYIQPLGRGSFDTCGLVGKLRAMGYKGPFGLQCYGIEGDVREHLAESLKAWRACMSKLGPPNPAGQ